MEGTIEPKPKIKGKNMTSLEQFENIKEWIEKIFDEIEKLNTKYEGLKTTTNETQHDLDKRLVVVEKFIEYRAKIELLLIGAIIGEAVGLAFLIAKALLQ